ncbi:MAG: SOS response-associated peptidase [Deltaproteobacteria bacterium]|nr:SOS response-associated peptidase [Deltaproteobacteria bacterium]
MCGRFVLISDLSIITEAFNIQEIACDYRPSTDILPSHTIAAVIHDGVNRLVQFRWGLIPSWAKDPSIGSRLINARAETLSEKPSFRNAFKKRRCLIIADGFYESLKEGKKKTPIYFRLKSGRPFGFAGLYEMWTSQEGQPVNTCTIITTEPNDLIQPIHNRMPVIVSKEKESLWIDPTVQNQMPLSSVLQTYPSAEMEAVSLASPADFPMR